MDNGSFEENGMKMPAEFDILQRILSWAKSEENVQALALTGSRAEGKFVHELSDYDLVLFVKAPEQYLKENGWISSFGVPWVIVREKRKVFRKTVQTRLVIFEGGVKVDWTIVPLDMLQKWMRTKPFSLLLDKGHLISQEKLIPKAEKLSKPAQKAFQTVVEEFWFEVYHVAVYLKRNDLWSAQFRFGLARDNFLLKMLEWKNGLSSHWEKKAPPRGKMMNQWIDKEIWHEVSQIFPHCQMEDCWAALSTMIELFRKVSGEIAGEFMLSYPGIIDNNITTFILKLRDGRDNHESRN